MYNYMYIYEYILHIVCGSSLIDQAFGHTWWSQHPFKAMAPSWLASLGLAQFGPSVVLKSSMVVGSNKPS